MKKVVNRIEEHMTEYPSIASRTTSVTEAYEFMKQMGIRHLPVMENGNVVGIVSERDLKQAQILTDSMQLLVSDVMTGDPYCVTVGTPLSTVAREMAKHKYGSTVVLNHLRQVVGIFTTTDGMRILSEVLSSERTDEVRAWGIERLLSSDTLI